MSNLTKQDKLDNIIEHLERNGFSENQIKQIKSSEILCDMIVSFTVGDTKKIVFTPHETKYGEDKIISIGQPYKNVLTLAHELGHALGKFQAFSPNTVEAKSAKEYVEQTLAGEGEAIATEYVVANEINACVDESLHLSPEKIGAKWSNATLLTETLVVHAEVANEVKELTSRSQITAEMSKEIGESSLWNSGNRRCN